MVFTECGILSILYKNNMCSNETINGLKQLQHRGRESFGISYVENIHSKKIVVVKQEGLVTSLEALKSGSSYSWLGHVRYSTTGKKNDSKNFMRSCQPLICNSPIVGYYSIAHNGNIPIFVWKTIQVKFPKFDCGCGFFLSDTNLIQYFINYLSNLYFIEGKYLNITIAIKRQIWVKILKTIIAIIPGAYSIVIQTMDELWVLRDRFGLRPLTLIQDDNKIMIASESIAFENYSNSLIDIKPGELLHIPYDTHLITSKYIIECSQRKHCVFEYLYFLREQTIVDGLDVRKFRLIIGEKLKHQVSVTFPNLIKSWKQDDALVCGVPTSGIVYGMGLANALDLSYNQFLKKRKDYPWRTFILDNNDKRIQACQKKYLIENNIIENRTIILVDDSIVRGNTLTYLIKYIKMYNPKEIHIISGTPPIKYSCHYGVDFPDMEELIANKVRVNDMAEHFGVDSVIYLEVDNLKKIKDNVCNACMTGEYLF